MDFIKNQNSISLTYLLALSTTKRQEMWESIFSSKRTKEYKFLAGRKNKVIGFANGDENREIEDGFEARLCAIYLSKSRKCKQICKAMFQVLIEAFDKESMEKMYL